MKKSTIANAQKKSPIQSPVKSATSPNRHSSLLKKSSTIRAPLKFSSLDDNPDAFSTTYSVDGIFVGDNLSGLSSREENLRGARIVLDFLSKDECLLGLVADLTGLCIGLFFCAFAIVDFFISSYYLSSKLSFD
jgi:hypothetical protein